MKNSKCLKLLFRIVLVALSVLILVPSVAVSAVSEKTDEIGYETYTYWYEFSGKTRKPVYSKPMYEVTDVKTSADLNGAYEIRDVHVSKKGFTYILDGNSRVIVFDQDYSIIKDFNVITDEDENNYTFSKASGIFVDDSDYIYIADTYNARVLKCDIDGKLVRLYLLPDSNLIPTGFNYSPTKIAVDSKGYVYILSSGSYYGAILYSPNDEFLGFYGANDVASTVMQALSTLWNRLFMNDTKRSQMTSALPYTFSDLFIDDYDFVYTTTGSTGELGQQGQVKRLNPGGSNILDSDAVDFSDEGTSGTLLSGPRSQSLIGVAADKDGFVYAVDATYGRIFIYDSDCRMVTAFGGGVKKGNQDGTFHTPSAIAYNPINQDIIISDSYNGTLTVFGVTEYGKLVKSAQAKTVVGNYEDSVEEWRQVLSLDRNCQLAYAGLAKAYYVMGQGAADEATANEYNDKAIELSKQGYDRETYALAFESNRTAFLRDNFTWIMLIAVAIVAVIVFVLVYSTKHNMRIIKNEKVHLAATVAMHPFENFREMKEKSLTSVPICLVIIILYYIFTVMETTFGGFSFVYFDPSSYNALLILAKTAGIVILWTVSNWAVCTLLGGKGKMKEIFSVISYSLIPSLISSIMFVLATNILVPDEATFLTVLMVIFQIYTYLMLAVGSMVVHDFGFGKFLWTTILTLLGCAIIVFLLITVGILLQQTGGFFATIYSEIIKLF